jgi:hypothetical protein
MFYHNIKDLTLAAMSWDSLTKDEQDKLTNLFVVYFHMLNWPPEGVCAITYAERQLVLAQEVTR